MDDATRENSPDNKTRYLPPETLPNAPDPDVPRSAASASEFTQVAQPLERTVEHPLQRGPERPHEPRQQASVNWESGATAASPRPAYVPPPQPGIPYSVPGKPNRQRNGYVLAVLALILFGGTLALSLGAFAALRIASSNRDDAMMPPSPVEVGEAGTEVGTPAPTPTVGLDIQAWDGKRRLTILLMGIDKRPGDKGTAFRTDSIIVFSIDPTNRRVGLLSVPRDLFVDIPTDTVVRASYGLQRVNSAYVIGELARPGYGPQLAMQTVQYNLGMRINDYIVFDFNTVIDAVNAVGGIDIDVPYTINDPAYPNMYYGYDPLYIPAGHIHMDGALALKYARTRHQTSDFDRAKRQQQVIMALRDKILNLDMAPTLIARAPELWAQFSDNTRSDLRFEHLLQLAVYLKDIPKENIRQGVLDINYVSPVQVNGASVLVPERARIGPLLVQIFGSNYNS